MIRRKSSLALAAMVAFALAGASTAFSQVQATTHTGTFPIFERQLVNYFTTVGSTTPSVNITVPEEEGVGNSIGDPDLTCAMIYVFDSNQLMRECCGCPVTSDGLRTIPINADLAAAPIFGGALQTGVIRLVAAKPNGCTQGTLASEFDALCIDGAPLAGVCDATGGSFPFGQFDFAPYTDNHAFTGKGAATLFFESRSDGDPLKAWATHVNVGALTETEFVDNPITQDDANNLAEVCGDIQQPASGGGAGVCSCGTGS